MTSNDYHEALFRAKRELFTGGWDEIKVSAILAELDKRKDMSFNCAVVWLPSSASVLRRKNAALKTLITRHEKEVIRKGLQRSSNVRVYYDRIRLRQWWQEERAKPRVRRKATPEGAPVESVEVSQAVEFRADDPDWKKVAGILRRKLGWVVSGSSEIVCQVAFSGVPNAMALLQRTLDEGGDVRFMTLPEVLEQPWQDPDEQEGWRRLYVAAMDGAWEHERARLSAAGLADVLEGKGRPAPEPDRL